MPDPRFPHMMPEDLPVWIRWLEAHTPDWERIDYDVKVGVGVQLPPDFAEPHRTNAINLSKKRIDAVLIYPDHHVIIEVKKLAEWKSIGQIMGYPVLYETLIDKAVPVSPLLVTETFELDIQGLFEHYELPFIIMPAPETAEEPPPPSPQYVPIPLPPPLVPT